MAVPRVLEKIEERIRDAASEGGAIKGRLLGWAAEAAHRCGISQVQFFFQYLVFVQLEVFRSPLA